MPRHLLSINPTDDAFSAERQAFIAQQAELLAEYAYFGDWHRYAALAEQLNSETSKVERGYIMGYLFARRGEL